MQKWIVPAVLFLGVLGSVPAAAQANICTKHLNSLFCLPNSLYGTPQGTASNPFLPWTPMFSAAGAQLSLLPLPSPASGILLRFDRSKAVYTQVNETLGPILSERAETIGKHRLFLALDYQRFMSDAMRDIIVGEVEAIRAELPDAKVTTNGMTFNRPSDYWEWYRHVDIVAWDAYPDCESSVDREAAKGVRAWMAAHHRRASAIRP